MGCTVKEEGGGGGGKEKRNYGLFKDKKVEPYGGTERGRACFCFKMLDGYDLLTAFIVSTVESRIFERNKVYRGVRAGRTIYLLDMVFDGDLKVAEIRSWNFWSILVVKNGAYLKPVARLTFKPGQMTLEPGQ